MTGPGKTTTCPTCRGAAARVTAAGPNKAFPFCSARCQMIDLGRWLDEMWASALDDLKRLAEAEERELPRRRRRRP